MGTSCVLLPPAEEHPAGRRRRAGGPGPGGGGASRPGGGGGREGRDPFLPGSPAPDPLRDPEVLDHRRPKVPPEERGLAEEGGGEGDRRGDPAGLVFLEGPSHPADRLRAGPAPAAG